jgi:hypothetical protein
MSNDHLDAHFRVIFDRLTASHRVALEELRDGNAALARAAAKGPLQKDGSRMPQPGWDVPPDFVHDELVREVAFLKAENNRLLLLADELVDALAQITDKAEDAIAKAAKETTS